MIEDSDHLTMDLDPDNEFLWENQAIEKVQNRFSELVESQVGQELSDYVLRKIGSDLESYIRQMLQAGEVSYNPDSRVLNYSMGLPRTPELL
ncbi:putative subunit of NAD(P)H:quinone oxidoreductase [Prochlorococcus marinus str. SS2]|nr:putative subunit of NAD(P)H:quinone oxidoreductase [Prochlorococcus marinus str. SS2]